MFQRWSQPLLPFGLPELSSCVSWGQLVTFLKGSGCLGLLSQLSYSSAVWPCANDLTALSFHVLTLTTVASQPIGEERVAASLPSRQGPGCVDGLWGPRAGFLGHSGVWGTSCVLPSPRRSNTFARGLWGWVTEPPPPPPPHQRQSATGHFLEGLAKCSSHCSPCRPKCKSSPDLSRNILLKANHALFFEFGILHRCLNSDISSKLHQPLLYLKPLGFQECNLDQRKDAALQSGRKKRGQGPQKDFPRTSANRGT